MKNIWLIAFLFIYGLIGGAGPGLYAASGDFSFSLRTDYDFSKKEMINSSKIKVPFIEVRGALKNNFNSGKIDFSNLKWNYGLDLCSQKLIPNFQINFKCGNLSATESLSKLNSPALSSTVSPFFSTSKLKAKSLDISLPQYNSFSSAQSYALQTIFKQDSLINQAGLNLFYNSSDQNQKGILTLNAFIKIKALKKSEINFSSTGGIYPYKKKNLTSWFTDESYYAQGQHFCMNNQFSFAAENFSSLFIMSSYRSPFATLLNTWRTENLFKTDNFTFKLDCFYNPNDEIITSSDKKINPLLQIDGGGQYRFKTQGKNLITIITGINSQADINLSQNSHNLKSAFGIRYSGNWTSGTFTAPLSFSIKKQAQGINLDFTGGSLDISSTIYLNNFLPGISGKFTFTPDSKKSKWTFTEKLGINAEYKDLQNNIKLLGKSNITFSRKTGEIKNKINFDLALKASFIINWCLIDLNLEFSM